MAKQKSATEKAIGKLISAIQKEWGDELGEQHSVISEDVMGRAHQLLKAGSPSSIREVLGELSLRQYLGEVWLQKHSSVKPYVSAVESAIDQLSSDA